MSDELDARSNGALDDLRALTRRDLSLYLCSKMQGLGGVVLRQLGVEVEVSEDCRAGVLMWLLPRFVNHVRDRAISSLVRKSYRRDKVLFKAAAATELLKVEKVRWENHRRHLLEVRRAEKPKDSEVVSHTYGGRYRYAIHGRFATSVGCTDGVVSRATTAIANLFQLC